LACFIQESHLSQQAFMDGLQLCKIIRSACHGKVIILSGHDEFEYAQEAIKLGVK